MAGDTADITATAPNAPLAVATVETAGKCVLLWPSARGRRSPPFRAAFSIPPAVLNANVNANGKRTFAFVPSMALFALAHERPAPHY